MTEDTITVTHGSLTIKVPRSLFKGRDAAPDEEKVRDFRNMLQRRYPWLSQNALDVVMRNARKEMMRVMDEETGGRNTSNRLASKGDYEKAIKHLERRIPSADRSRSC